jgi:hypothetical protein
MRQSTFVLFLLTFILLGCSESLLPTETKLGNDISGQSAVYSSNQRFTLELDVHFDGGYQWLYSIGDTNIVKLDSTSFRSKSDQQVAGGLAVETFFFRTINNGKSIVNLKECRVWEQDVPPINTLSFGVFVK